MLQILYTIRSARLLMEQLGYNLLFRCCVGLFMDDKVWDHSVFSKNQERFLDSDLADAFFARIHQQAARLFKRAKGKEAKLCFMGHVLMENRQGLVAAPRPTQAGGTAEREAALALVEAVPGRHRITVGGDKGYDTREFVQSRWALKATPHVAQNNKNRRSAINGRTTRHPGYAVSQRLRQRVEEISGWLKTVGSLRTTRHRGLERVGFLFTLTAAADNLVRMRNLPAKVPS